MLEDVKSDGVWGHKRRTTSDCTATRKRWDHCMYQNLPELAPPYCSFLAVPLEHHVNMPLQAVEH